MTAAGRIGPRSDRHRLAGTPIEKIRFPGGLSLLLWPDRRRSHAALRCYVRGGSIAEPSGGSGVAHLLEHLITGHVAERLWHAGEGALLRAFTTRDHTGFAWSALEGDAAPSMARFLAALEDPQSLALRLPAERAVVAEEIQLLARDPLQLLHQGFVETAFDVHPIRHPVCGREPQVRRADAAGLRRYMSSVYSGPNLHLVAVGGFAAEEIVATARAADARLPGGERFRLAGGGAEPARAVPRRCTIEPPGPCHSYTLIGFRTLAAEPDEERALHALAVAVREGRSGLEREIAGIPGARAGAFDAHTPFGAGWFAVRIEHPPGHAADVEERTLSWLDRLRRGEVEKLLPPAAAADLCLDDLAWTSPDDLDATSALLGAGEVSLGDPLAALRFQLAALQVDAKAIARAVSRHAVNGNLTIASLGCPGAEGARRSRRVASRRPGHRALLPRPAWEPRAGRLANGTALLVLPTPGALASCQVMWRGGSLRDGRRRSGLAHLTAVLLAAGENVEVYPFSDENFSGLALTCRGDDLLSALPRLAARALRPQISPAGFRAGRDRLAAHLARPGRTTWSEDALLGLRRRLYRLHPFGRPETGSCRSVAALTLDQVMACHKSSVTGGHLAVVIAGDVDCGWAYERLEELFAAAPAGQLDLPQVPEPTRPGGAVRHHGKGPRGLSTLALGYPGISWEERTWGALELARTLLAGPENRALGGRLIRALRAAGCAYDVQCLNQSGFGEGYFAVLAVFAPAEEARALRIVSAELDRLRRGEVEAAEVATCRKLLRLHRLLLGETPRSLAYFAGRQALYSDDAAAWLTMDERLAAIGIDELAALAGRCLAPAAEVAVLTRPAASIEERS